ncbi:MULTISPECIES: NFACT family protein [unclassified Meiothermus]|uniref:Rqc2 family fibronectin-binding protein n=1 Tax=unclassified Meiothermus TaxID=370471 RepID=UPI000D7D1EB3|nr:MULTISPECIES: NFACT family protein [unclassified Meiothermus]PZA07845.1 fibronectin-binding domain-containing protein [Meiothermus sp. Pnk-1]RYM38851.1 fibronectin-binding domain-containing protein [Meiothermus sp. PNK-Is4]
MEGLLIHAILRDLKPRLPAQSLGWVFPDEGTAALLLAGIGNLVLRYRPPNPILTLEPGELEGEPKTPFQRMLATRAKGRLLEAQQVKLDRVVQLFFEGEHGFVDTPPTRLLFELTGRNANLILTDPEGRILGLDRNVTHEVNRFRELRPGLPYTPPPPYHKLDPRSATQADLRVLLGQKLAQAVQKNLDGIGKELAQELARRAGLTPETLLAEAHLPALYQALQSLIARPKERTALSEELRASWEREETEALRKPLREALLRRKKTLEARLEDCQKALARLDEAAKLRAWGDLLLAYGKQLKSSASEAVLADFQGQEVKIPLEPGLSPAQNAQKYYARAKRLEANALRALELEPKLQQQLAELEAELEAIEKAGRSELVRLERTRQERPSQVGLRFQSPSGFTVWVGRSSKENEFLTRTAHSQDLWFHVQGLPGSHVILRTAGQNAPLPDLLFAAQLAAFYSKAKGDKNVPVDYTAKKNVWRPRKAAAGQVLYTGAKTLFVDAKLPEGATEG